VVWWQPPKGNPMIAADRRRVIHRRTQEALRGWRSKSTREMTLGFVKNAPKDPVALRGYISALYHIRANALPAAYDRDPAVQAVQTAAGVAARKLEVRYRRAMGKGGPSLESGRGRDAWAWRGDKMRRRSR
jgi:hypothetical protein